MSLKSDWVGYSRAFGNQACYDMAAVIAGIISIGREFTQFDSAIQVVDIQRFPISAGVFGGGSTLR